jgi:hypothetical protein
MGCFPGHDGVVRCGFVSSVLIAVSTLRPQGTVRTQHSKAAGPSESCHDNGRFRFGLSRGRLTSFSLLNFLDWPGLYGRYGSRIGSLSIWVKELAVGKQAPSIGEEAVNSLDPSACSGVNS